ncbi:hypothetical protein SALWKB2_1287 [Snodgrassella alvi wkB2]|nr:hypothetical protein SALWKB2_1287 [Snodgrassella alvi wkB2]
MVILLEQFIKIINMYYAEIYVLNSVSGLLQNFLSASQNLSSFI